MEKSVVSSDNRFSGLEKKMDEETTDSTDIPEAVVSDLDSKALHNYAVSKRSRKLTCVIFILTYHVGSFVLSRSRIQFLDSLTAQYFTDNVLSRSAEAFMTFMNSNYSRFQLATIGTMIAHILCYWTACLPGLIYQFLPFMDVKKIQKKSLSFRKQFDCFLLVIINQLTFETVFMLANYYFVTGMNYGWDFQQFPTWYQLIGTMIGCLALEDTWHFIFHYTVHQPTLYRIIHKLHHNYPNPVGMEAEYAHPLEIFLLGIGFILGCSIYCNHFYCTWLWMFVRIFETVEVHGGYDYILPGNIAHFLPMYAGPRFHDFHHSNFVGNYASTFLHWDTLFETDYDYRIHEAKRLLLQKQKTNSHKKYTQIEKKQK